MTQESLATITVALIGLVGNLAGVSANLYIQWRKDKHEEHERALGADATAEIKQRLEKQKKALRRWRDRALASFILSLIVMIIVGFLPGEENSWFVRVNLKIFVAAGLGAALVLVLPVVFSRTRGRGADDETEQPSWMRILLYVGLGVYLAGSLFLGWKFIEWEKQPPHGKLTLAAWSFFESERYHLALTVTDRCTTNFGKQAKDLQNTLANTSAPQPPVGTVPPAEQEPIFRNGVLNDVATCYWIKGRSAQNLHQNESARQALTAACGYTYARTWDPKGFFWAPAKDACDRLQDLQ